mmetsp:Transcript_115394/g.235965  ORF Transcript_115394/g.235965 Transcript_115394/m.235965 type:complete len:92 (-) Transcript_115394:2406-2681(-)
MVCIGNKNTTQHNTTGGLRSEARHSTGKREKQQGKGNTIDACRNSQSKTTRKKHTHKHNNPETKEYYVHSSYVKNTSLYIYIYIYKLVFFT